MLAGIMQGLLLWITWYDAGLAGTSNGQVTGFKVYRGFKKSQSCMSCFLCLIKDYFHFASVLALQKRSLLKYIYVYI